jgi:hypothetical protein
MHRLSAFIALSSCEILRQYGDAAAMTENGIAG